jgi:hypothetical protein
MRAYSGPDLVEDSLILWEQPAFGDLAVLEPIYAVGTPLDRLASSLGSPRSDDESVLIVCQNVIDGDAPILSRDRAATRNVPDGALGEKSGKGCDVPLSPGIVLTSQVSLVWMQELPLPKARTRHQRWDTNSDPERLIAYPRQRKTAGCPSNRLDET